ncbi:MAG TPA: butyrate kinase, partial [Firmicutes bacterium]|nr:butyrate kinase [Bacillota bacterium]
PFGLRQSGGLPFDGVIDLCVASGNREQTLGVLHSEGGLEGYLGVQGLEELWSKQGERADLIREALIYQISKEIGALVTVLKGRVDALILGGDLVDAKPFGQAIKRRIEFLGPIVMYPGNQVLPALLAAGERVQV